MAVKLLSVLSNTVYVVVEIPSSAVTTNVSLITTGSLNPTSFIV